MESVHLEGFLFCFQLCGNSNFLVSNSSRLYLYRSGLEGACTAGHQKWMRAHAMQRK